MRKLARQAVIFALLGQLLATVGFFVRLDLQDRAAAKEQAKKAVHAFATTDSLLPYLTGQTKLAFVLVPVAHEDKVLAVKVCNGSNVIDDVADRATNHPPEINKFIASQPEGCREFVDTTNHPATPHHSGIGNGDGGWQAMLSQGDPDQVAIERDYWTAYKQTRDRTSSMLYALLTGLVGFPAGLGLWGFYRLILFAVKG